jgi:hypothetical protein
MLENAEKVSISDDEREIKENGTSESAHRK